MAKIFHLDQQQQQLIDDGPIYSSLNPSFIQGWNRSDMIML